MAVQTVVTWDDVEVALLEMMQLDARSPNKEGGFLSAGSRSCWPDVVRLKEKGEYPEARGRVGLRTSEVDRLNKMQEMIVRVVLREDILLLRKVLEAKLDGRGEGFRWERIWQWDDKRRREQGRIRVSSDAVRKRYDAAVTKVAKAIDKLPSREQALMLGLGMA